MFQRFMNAIRSILGLFVRNLENPELLLQQYMDDMRAQVPRLNDTVAEVMKQEILLRDTCTKQQHQVTELDAQVVAAVKLGPQYEEEAKMLLSKMEQVKADLARNQALLTTAHDAAQKAKVARDDYLRQMEIKIQEARSALSRVKQAQMQEQLSSMMMTFKVGDHSDVIERMTEKIDERSAKAQARMELATSGLDSRMQDIQRATTQSSVDSKLVEYKRQLGMLPPEDETATRTMTPTPETPPQQPQ